VEVPSPEVTSWNIENRVSQSLARWDIGADIMLFTITRKLDQLPSYPILCKLAEQSKVSVIGNEHTGSFSSSGVEGTYEFSEQDIRGTFAGHGVKGEFSIEQGNAAITITEKPFWLPETLLKQKIADGLNKLCEKMVGLRD